MATSKRRRGDGGAPVAPAGYTAIPVKFSEKHQSPHYLYVKQHKVREETDPNRPPNRTLFILNVPPYCTEDEIHRISASIEFLIQDFEMSASADFRKGQQAGDECLSRLFSSCCSVQSVEMCQKPRLGEKTEAPESKFFNTKTMMGFKVAYVLFKSPAGIRAAQSLSTRGPLLISSVSYPVHTGIQKWIAGYAASVIDPAELKKEVDAFMQAYDQKVAEEDANAENEDGVPDEDGWVKVTRKGRRPGLPRTEAANLRALEREKHKRARKELLNFYAWQHRETKREHIAQLRKKFEEDKQKIALMRAQRKFRPY